MGCPLLGGDVKGLDAELMLCGVVLVVVELAPLVVVLLVALDVAGEGACVVLRRVVVVEGGEGHTGHRSHDGHFPQGGHGADVERCGCVDGVKVGAGVELVAG